jgi:hypothetical protein
MPQRLSTRERVRRVRVYMEDMGFPVEALNLAALPSLATTHVIRRAVYEGSRTTRDVPLRADDLWVNGIRPPVLTTLRKHQECSICEKVKCHPVS